MRLRKTYEIASFKALPDTAGATGRFEAIVSVFGNVDLVGDRVMPGAFKTTLNKWRAEAAPIPVIWSHDWADPFAHVGWADPAECEEILSGVRADGASGLLIRGQFDVDKPFAAQVYDLLKERRVKEWSFAYDTIRERTADDGANDLLELDLIEVGPTLKGANPATVTLGVKAATQEAEVKEALKEAAAIEKRPTAQRLIDRAMELDPSIAKALLKTAPPEVKTAIASHSTDTTDTAWDGNAMSTNLPNEADALRAAHAWRDPEGDETAKDTYKFIHHMVSDAGAVGAANITACRTGIGVLNGGRGGTTIPEADVQGVYNHLAKHLSDADLEPPELASEEPDDAKAVDDVKVGTVHVDVIPHIIGGDVSVNDVRKAIGLPELTDEELVALKESLKDQHTGAIDGMRQHLIEKHGWTEEQAEGKDLDALKAAHDDIDHEGLDHDKDAKAADTVTEVNEDVSDEDDEPESKATGPDGAKAGRVIGAKRVSDLKSALGAAIDAWAEDVNGAAEDAPDDEKRVADDVLHFKSLLDQLEV